MSNKAYPVDKNFDKNQVAKIDFAEGVDFTVTSVLVPTIEIKGGKYTLVGFSIVERDLLTPKEKMRERYSRLDFSKVVST